MEGNGKKQKKKCLIEVGRGLCGRMLVENENKHVMVFLGSQAGRARMRTFLFEGRVQARNSIIENC